MENGRWILFLMWGCFSASVIAFLWLTYRMLRTRHVRATECGHMTSLYPNEHGLYVQKVAVDILRGKKKILTIVPDKDGYVGYCGRCLQLRARNDK